MIVEYDSKYDEQIKDLLVELQNYLIDIDNWHTQIITPEYREKYFKMDMEKVKNQDGKIYLEDYFNKYYDTSANKYYEERIAYINTYIGSLGYNIYEKNEDGTLNYLGRTDNTTFTVSNPKGGNTTYVIKAAYSLFKALVS